ncbi:LruC domain-containing protein [Mucilaginibacter sp. HMF5004]|uniref:LruC domain-containing protein n=1 Tax=Mucilaginibacter rivuli TaxID=2857527 RepID=UPI001C6077B7|nr:LruC domain-containing protein [Mucilaginibacter rivuli]MBW4888229.1 LruC domain-containing protein [Mucilaginibacter rivuli]
MKIKVLIVAALMSTFAITSCKKVADNGEIAVNTTINDIKVPAGFTWESSRAVSFTVNMTDSRFGTNAVHVISVYDGDPSNGGSLVSRGSATTTTAYTSNLYLSNQIKQVYVVKTSPDGSSITQKVTVGTAPVSITIGAIDPAVASVGSSSSAKILGGTVTSPDCNSGCTVTITSSTNNLNVNTGDLICITGSNITVSFSNINGGTVRVCGSNVTLQNANLNNSSSLIITSSGSATMSGNINSTSATLQNFGTLTYSGSFSDNGIFDNEGTFTNSGDFNMNSNSNFTNNGTMTVSGAMNVNTSNATTNSGSITTTGDFTANSNSNFTNNCSLNARGNFNDNGTVKNYNLIKAAGTATINSNNYLYMYNGAMISAVTMMLNGAIIGSGSTSLVKISGNTTINSSGTVQNAIQYCSGGSFTNYGSFSGGAAQGCSVYIATSGCNSDGNGTPTVTDTDGDGVADNLDAYPTDKTKAYDNYYPSAASGGVVAFEDQWPAKGDYDMNDLVIGYKYKIVTNASNVVVQVSAAYSLMATGGTVSNGFGVQFPTTYASVSGLTGGTLESGQTKAVVILFSDSRNEMANWNTVAGATTTATKTYTVLFNITNGPTLSAFGLSSYNPFIYNFGRNREVHLMGQTPTDLADKTLLGTQDDNSSVASSRYYVTKTGLPYALDVPVSTFSYPSEGSDITKAYLHFSDWATSSGSSYTDWYSNTGTGYRSTTYIYK